VFLSGYRDCWRWKYLWVRIMGQVGQYHAYLFPTVLGIFLLADGLGMAVAARMVRHPEGTLARRFSSPRVPALSWRWYCWPRFGLPCPIGRLLI
jgi:hypothetical protein